MHYPRYWLAAIFAALLTVTPSVQAQFTDEVWVEARWFDTDDSINCDGSPDPCCNHYRSSLRSDFLPTFTQPSQWPTGHDRVVMFSSLLGLVQTCNDFGHVTPPRPPRVTDAQLASLIDYINDNNIKINFDVGALRINAFCGFENGEQMAGEKLADANFPQLRRWYENGGVIDSLSADHPILWMYRYQADGVAKPDCVNMTYQEGATEVADYFERLEQKFAEAFAENVYEQEVYAPKLLLWESAGNYAFEHPDGAITPAVSTFPTMPAGLLLNDVVAEIRTKLSAKGLDLDSYSIDFSPASVEAEGNGGQWDFSRVINLEATMRHAGLRVGISNHLGPCANDFDGNPCQNVTPSDQWAHDTFVRYAREYVLAGGNPDFLQAYSWHDYPSLSGPETQANTMTQIVGEVLNDYYPEPVVMPLPADDFSAVNSRWTFTGGWSPSAGVLASPSSSGTYTAVLNEGTFESVRIQAKVENLVSTSNGWAGFHLRKVNAADPPWVGGYLVQVRRVPEDLTQRRLLLTRPGKTLGDIQVTASGAITLTADLRGNRIRVSVNGEERIDIVDNVYASGHVALVALNENAEFDDFEIEPIQLGDRQVEDRFDDDSDLGWDIDGSLSESAGTFSGSGKAIITGFSAQNLRFGADMSLAANTGGGWAAIHLRKPGLTSAPWHGGYAVLLKPNGLLTLYASDGGSVDDFSIPGHSDSTVPVRLEMAVSESRVRVWTVDLDSRETHLAFDYWHPTQSVTAGNAGITTFNQTVTVDNVVVETLEEHTTILNGI